MPPRIMFVNTLDGKKFARHICIMETQHPHAAAIDRLGRQRIINHFNITPRAIQKWRKGGVPRIHWNTVRVLAATSGVQVPEIGE